MHTGRIHLGHNHTNNSQGKGNVQIGDQPAQQRCTVAIYRNSTNTWQNTQPVVNDNHKKERD